MRRRASRARSSTGGAPDKNRLRIVGINRAGRTAWPSPARWMWVMWEKEPAVRSRTPIRCAARAWGAANVHHDRPFWAASDVCADSGDKRPPLASGRGAVAVCADSGGKRPSPVSRRGVVDVCVRSAAPCSYGNVWRAALAASAPAGCSTHTNTAARARARPIKRMVRRHRRARRARKRRRPTRSCRVGAGARR